MCKRAVWSSKWPVDGRQYARVMKEEHGLVVLLYKGKGNVLECGNYRTIQLLEHGMRVVEHMFEKD